MESGWQASWNDQSIIARGLGRSYGDASLGKNMLSTLKNSGIIDLNNDILKAKAGTSLKEILEYIVPKGYFLPVTPGTKYVTLGGAIAADVHGKNHHVDGTIGNFVEGLELISSPGISINCSKNSNSDVFNWTCGGMGLTGVIDQASIRLKKIESNKIVQKIEKGRNLEELLNLFEKNSNAPYSVAWLDSLKAGKNFGRGILYLGHHATTSDLKDQKLMGKMDFRSRSLSSLPFFLPSFAMNKLNNSLFNELFYFKGDSSGLIDLDKYFYPLDAIGNWNRAYGRKGFVQYQMVIPSQHGINGVSQILKEIQKEGLSSFLTVLKFLGDGRGFMSFPIKGYTLAMDFPVRSGLFKKLDRVDAIVHEMGGRVYLAKDSRLNPKNLEKGYPELENFKKFISSNTFSSQLSNRLGIT